MKVSDLLADRENTVAIVHYMHPSVLPAEAYHLGMPPQNPAILLQATFRRGKLSQSKKLIRLGDTPGDEIVGWTKLEWLEVVEVLGEAEITDKGVKVTPISEPVGLRSYGEVAA